MERKFEWDPEKEASNRVKHGLGFALARRVFQDPFRLTKRDMRFEYNEDRYITLGMVEERLFVVVYTYRGDATRIVSVRKANLRERKRYDHRSKEA